MPKKKEEEMTDSLKPQRLLIEAQEELRLMENHLTNLSHKIKCPRIFTEEQVTRMKYISNELKDRITNQRVKVDACARDFTDWELNQIMETYNIKG